MKITLQLKINPGALRGKLRRPFRKVTPLNQASRSAQSQEADRQERLLKTSLDRLTELTHHFSQVQEMIRRMDIIERVEEQLRDELDQHLDEDLFSDDDLFTDDDRAATPKSPLADSIAICVPGPEGEEC